MLRRLLPLIVLCLLLLCPLHAQSTPQTTWFPLTGMNVGPLVPTVTTCMPPSFFFNTHTNALYMCNSGVFTSLVPTVSVYGAENSGNLASYTIWTSSTDPYVTSYNYRACASLAATANGSTGYTLPTVTIAYTSGGSPKTATVPNGGCTLISTDPSTTATPSTVSYSTSGYGAGSGGSGMTYSLALTLNATN